MKISLSGIKPSDLDVDLLAVPVSRDTRETVGAEMAAAFGDSVMRAVMDFETEKGGYAIAYTEKGRAPRLLFIGTGDSDVKSLEDVRQVAAAAVKPCRSVKASTVGWLARNGDLSPADYGQAVVEGFMLAGYSFRKYKTDTSNEPHQIERLVLRSSQELPRMRRGAEQGKIVADATMHARDLVNLSPNDKTPKQLAKMAQQSARQYGYEAIVMDKAEIEKEKMGGLLAVNAGSQEPPTFTILEWHPESSVNNKPVVLVGKGVVFDTGGLSLKPTKDSMDYMKADMAGAAAVLGAIQAIARLELPIYVVGLIPATDNRPGENAYVPGDVIKMHSGKTVEVLNTDAEGRMILADALSYASMYHPELVIDLATLTGAQVVALGTQVAAVMTAETKGAEERIAAFVAAGNKSGDRVAPLPMFDEYAKQLESDVADIKNVGGRAAGSITAGKFLEHFTSYPWVHVDIAGPAFTHTARTYHPVGGTGFGVRLLVSFLSEYSRNRSA